MRITLLSIQEVRYSDIIVDAGAFVPDALESSKPMIVIDVGRERDWSTMSGVRYCSVPVGADGNRVN
jgi:predicted nucleic acid-binding Zn finger protein